MVGTRHISIYPIAKRLFLLSEKMLLCFSVLLNIKCPMRNKHFYQTTIRTVNCNKLYASVSTPRLSYSNPLTFLLGCNLLTEIDAYVYTPTYDYNCTSSKLKIFISTSFKEKAKTENPYNYSLKRIRTNIHPLISLPFHSPDNRDHHQFSSTLL